MNTVSLKISLTDAEFEKLADANQGKRLESSASGELIIMPPTGGNTGRRNTKITTQLENWSSQNSCGETFDSSTLFVLPNGARRSPDTSWVRRERWNALTPEQQDKYPPLCPDFVVELRSPTDDVEELQNKMKEYWENGAELGWLIDPKTKKVEIYRQGKTIEILESPAMLSGENVLPGFVLNLKLIFA